MIDKNLYKQKIIKSWSDLNQETEKDLGTGENWIFRGQKFNPPDPSEPDLETNLGRAILNYGGTLKNGINGKSVAELEAGLLREFKRKCHKYISNPPEEENILEWLALMQHYGSPTRLLDWTYSLNVALYFALSHEGCECAVWAVNKDWLRTRAKKIINDKKLWNMYETDECFTESATFRGIFPQKNPKKMVIAVNPFKLNERLIIQQGIFLCPGDVSVPFDKNLEELLNDPSDPNVKNNLVRYQIENRIDLKKELFTKLHRMNMNAAFLFPDINGFSTSLRTLLLLNDILIPDPLIY